VLLSLKADGKDVQGEMVDRILDGGEYLSDISSRRRQMKERQGR
jgi:hypothetical protein